MFSKTFLMLLTLFGNPDASSEPIQPAVQPAHVTTPSVPAVEKPRARPHRAAAVERAAPASSQNAPAQNAPAQQAAPSQSAAPSQPATPLRVAARLDAGTIVSRVQGFYTDAKQLTALFRQTYTNSTFGKKSISDGKVWIKKPGKMRWDYKGKRIKVQKSFVSDGMTLWAVEHDNKQVLQQSLGDNMLPVAITFLYGKGDLSRDFTAILDNSGKYGKKSDYVLALTPRTPSAQYKKLYLVVDPGNFRVKQSIVLEASGNINHFRFFSPDTKRLVKDSWFVVNVKKLAKASYRIIEPDKKTKN